MFKVSKKKKSLFVVGDSISIRYGPFLNSMTKVFFDYGRKGGINTTDENLDNVTDANGGDSSMVLSYLTKKFNRGGFKPDILLLNAGLHDIKTNPDTDKKQVPKTKYEENIAEIVNLVTANKVFAVWVKTTPVNDEIHKSKKSEFWRFNRDVLMCNEIADRVFTKNHWPIIDLYSFTSNLDIPLYADHVHFFEEVAKLQAAFIMGFLVALTD